MNRKEILKQTISGIALKKNTNKLFVIGFVGLPGSGKSYIAKMISTKAGIPIRSNDQIRRLFNNLNIQGESPNQSLLQEIADEATNLLLVNQVSHIIDADLYMFVDEARKRVESFGGELILIKVVANESEILERIKQRRFDTSNASKALSEKYFLRKKLYETQDKHYSYYYTIENTDSLSVEEQVESLLEKLI